MKVTDRIHLVVDSPFQPLSPIVYILLGKEIALIDTGFRTTPEKRIFPYLEQLGRSPSEISLIILTHGHGDHYEGIPAIKKASGAKVAIHKADAWLIEEDKDAPLFRSLSLQYPDCFRPLKGEPYPKADILLKDGDTLEAGYGEFQVFGIPGHTEGSIALYDPKERLAFSGDQVSGEFIHFYLDPDTNIASDRRLLSLRIDTLLPAHKYPPATEFVLRGSEAMAFIQRHIEAIEGIKQRIKEILRTSRRPLSPHEVAEALKGPSLITVIKFLEYLAQRGEAITVKAETKYW
jgi:glyoxylase-like metal-dependent hydrolase (beta-lactamase superfamily II)